MLNPVLRIDNGKDVKPQLRRAYIARCNPVELLKEQDRKLLGVAAYLGDVIQGNSSSKLGTDLEERADLCLKPSFKFEKPDRISDRYIFNALELIGLQASPEELRYIETAIPVIDEYRDQPKPNCHSVADFKNEFQVGYAPYNNERNARGLPVLAGKDLQPEKLVEM